MRVFEVDAATFDADDEDRLIADLREATAEEAAGEPPSLVEIKQVVAGAPAFARQYLRLHHAFRRMDERLKATERCGGRDEYAAASAILPYEEVRDFFHYRNNYIHDLDLAAERLAATCGLGEGDNPDAALIAYLAERCGVRTVIASGLGGVLRRFDPASGVMTLDGAQPAESRTFQLAYQLVATELRAIIDAELASAGFRTPAARDVARSRPWQLRGWGDPDAVRSLPPGRPGSAARRRAAAVPLPHQLRAGLPSAEHPAAADAQRLPFYFAQADLAGNITSGTAPRACSSPAIPAAADFVECAWCSSFGRRILIQLAEMPDGVRYLCVAKGIVKPSGAFDAPERRYAIGLGCDRPGMPWRWSIRAG